ncbi:MAG: hypothetical protein HGA78_07605 [Nitrospirales bacterium]|nr:hypothetical protein [Nitrospirales bacterium]
MKHYTTTPAIKKKRIRIEEGKVRKNPRRNLFGQTGWDPAIPRQGIR